MPKRSPYLKFLEQYVRDPDINAGYWAMLLEPVGFQLAEASSEWEPNPKELDVWMQKLKDNEESRRVGLKPATKIETVNGDQIGGTAIRLGTNGAKHRGMRSMHGAAVSAP